MIPTLGIGLYPNAQAGWLATVDLDEDELESFEQRQMLDEQRREREAAAERERAALDAVKEQRPRAIWRYEPDGTPIYDDDPRLAHLFKTPNRAGAPESRSDERCASPV